MTSCFVALPIFAVGVDVVGGGGWVDVPVMTTEIFIQLQHGFMAAEVEKVVQRVLYAPDIAALGEQNIIDNRLIVLRCLLLKIVQFPDTGKVT